MLNIKVKCIKRTDAYNPDTGFVSHMEFESLIPLAPTYSVGSVIGTPNAPQPAGLQTSANMSYNLATAFVVIIYDRDEAAKYFIGEDYVLTLDVPTVSKPKKKKGD